MIKVLREVAIGDRGPGQTRCIHCDERMYAGFPTNYPQVCHECADKYVWHYCDRLPQQKNALGENS